jgi:ABC-type Fe3+ transport system permease subunit
VDDGWLLLRSLAVAGLSGVVCAIVALIGCWLARESRWLGGLLLIVLATAWAMPGPVLGLGLKGVFRFLVDSSASVSDVPGRLLWYGPSSLPLVAVYVVRFLPCAAALLWPAVRLLPVGLLEASRLDGAGPASELSSIVWPLMRPAFGRAALVVAILSLGELSAGKLVSTPGAESYAEAVWTQMHYGVTAELAARCLLLLAVVLFAALGLAGSWSGYNGSETAAPNSALRATASVNSM